MRRSKKENTMAIQKVVVRHTVEGHGRPAENSAEFGVRFPLKKFTTEASFRNIVSMGDEVINGPEIAAIAALPGVSKVSSWGGDSRYELIMRKGSAFTWEELTPAITALLEQWHDRM